MRRVECLTLSTLLLGALSCGRESPTESIPVASVSIAVVGDTLLLPTQQVLLVASVRDAAGKILPDRSVEWSSSDSAVATVAQTGWVTAVNPGTVILAAVSEGKGAIAHLVVRPIPVASVTITNLGDSVVEDGTTRPLTATARDSVGRILADRTTFAWSSSDTAVATVTSSGVVQGVWEGSVSISATVEGRSGSIVMRVVSRPVASIILHTGGLGALYAPRDSLSLDVTLLAGTGDTLNRAHRPLLWTSSNVSVATVDTTGIVTGVSAGPVTISASREGRTGSVNLKVLPAPMSNWAAAKDWVTFQANAEHDGHVAATADPRSFHDWWTKVLVPGTALSPVVTSEGRAFVATESYFGTQLLGALDAATSQTLWVQNFGSIHGVNEPAVGNGRVYVTTSGQGDSFLYAFDAATGSRVFRTPYGCQWERYYAPVVTSDAVYMAGGYYGGMYRFNAITGDSDWFFQTNQFDAWTPAFKDTVVYSYTGPRLTANSARSGGVLYEMQDSGFAWNSYSMNTAPVLGGAETILAVQATRLVIFDLSARALRWEQNDQYRGAVSVGGGVLYVVNGDAVEARSETDGTLLWLWVVPAGTGIPRGALALTDNLLFVSTESRTYALDLQGQTAVWSYPAGGRLSISSQGILYIAQANGSLTAVALQ